MARIGTSAVVFLSLLLLAIGGAHATFFGTPQPASVTGQLCCTQNGNCPGTAVPLATVTLTCLGSFLSPGVSLTTTTNAAGAFTFTFTTTSQAIPFIGFFTFAKCFVTVPLPVPVTSACPVLSNTGGRLIALIVSTGQVNGVQTGTAGPFLRSL